MRISLKIHEILRFSSGLKRKKPCFRRLKGSKGEIFPFSRLETPRPPYGARATPTSTPLGICRGAVVRPTCATADGEGGGRAVGIPLCPSRAVMARRDSKGERRGTRQPIGMKERECVSGHWSVCEAPPRRQHVLEWRLDGARSVCRRQSLGTGSAAIVSHGGRC